MEGHYSTQGRIRLSYLTSSADTLCLDGDAEMTMMRKLEIDWSLFWDEFTWNWPSSIIIINNNQSIIIKSNPPWCNCVINSVIISVSISTKVDNEIQGYLEMICSVIWVVVLCIMGLWETIKLLPELWKPATHCHMRQRVCVEALL